MKRKRYVSPVLNVLEAFEPESSILNASDINQNVETRGMQVMDYVEGEDFDSAWYDETE